MADQDAYFQHLAVIARDWQLANGSMLRLSMPNLALSSSIGICLFPTPFPRSCFDDAKRIQNAYNELYARISSDEDWLKDVLQGAIREDEFTSKLWNIHVEASKSPFHQGIHLGIFRSDYMVQCTSTSQDIKQVEFNTFSVAGAGHAHKVSELHRYLLRTGLYHHPASYLPRPIPETSLPTNLPISSIMNALSTAHALYGPPRSPDALPTTGILMTVQPNNVNTCDENPIVHGLWTRTPPIPTHRILFSEVMATTSLCAKSGALLFRAPYMPISSPPLEISIVYHRAGIDAEEYDTVGIAGRLRVESSIAIKCPTVLGHLAGSKIVQQVLSITSPTSTISRQFLSPTHNPEIAEAIERTFEVMLPLTDTTPGHIGREIALNPRKAADWILKPCREGGGHNIFGRDISEFLRAMEIKKWDQLIIMKKIEPTITQSGVLLTRAWGNVFNTSHSAVESVGEGENDCEGLDEGLVQAEVVSELGIFGTCVWRTRRSIGHTEKDNEASRADILLNETSGWSFKCKPVGVNEMSVVKGYGCFGSPFLVDEI